MKGKFLTLISQRNGLNKIYNIAGYIIMLFVDK